MRRKLTIVFAVVIVFGLVAQVLGALSDAGALKKAKMYFGAQVRIGTVRNATASNWTKQIGIDTIGCEREFTVLGEGFNTWDAAFADYDAKVAAGTPPIKNHYKVATTVTPVLTPTGFANTAPVTVKIMLDGLQFLPDGVITNGTISPINIDPTILPVGAHAFCFQIKDAAGGTSKSPAWMFFKD